MCYIECRLLQLIDRYVFSFLRTQHLLMGDVNDKTFRFVAAKPVKKSVNSFGMFHLLYTFFYMHSLRVSLG